MIKYMLLFNDGNGWSYVDTDERTEQECKEFIKSMSQIRMYHDAFTSIETQFMLVEISRIFTLTETLYDKRDHVTR